ncbi:MAG: class I SAM-dependent methyltransferase [Candidatus Riflebacteria bacterium]|nr:class I SAM-dependent methyltransferase [Candidatus Riflebacteria bacterium]
MVTKLNLGCGEFKKEGYVNVDCFAVSEPDIRHDLNSFPYPFEENSFTLIEADHLLEHLNDPFQVMRELYRIGADGCKIKLRMPHFSRGFTHAQHHRGFDVSFPLYFNPSFQGGYQGVPLRLEKMRLRWFAQPYLKKTVLPAPFYYAGKTLGTIIDFFANASPFVCSRLWCFWVGGFEEIEIVFSVNKSNC